MILIKEK